MHGLVGGCYGILAIKVHLAYIGTLKTMCHGVKIFHLCHDAHGEVHIVKSLNEIQSTLTLYEAIPKLSDCISYRADGTQSSNYNSSFHFYFEFLNYKTVANILIYPIR